MADEYKALSVVNLPFIEERYQPGQMIPRASFEKYVEAAKEALGPEAEVDDADTMIANMTEYGSLSDDPDAKLHPAHLPVDPGAPTMGRMVEQAKILAAQLEESGQEVPPEIKAMASVDYNHAVSGEEGEGGDRS